MWHSKIAFEWHANNNPDTRKHERKQWLSDNFVLYLVSAKKTNKNGSNLHVKFDLATTVGTCII